MMKVRPSLIGWIRANLPLGRTILELGSGEGTTADLCRGYNLFSVEHDAKWVGRYRSHYIHAPLRDGWYDRPSLKKALPSLYHLLIIDGPPGKSRGGIIRFFNIFRSDTPIIIDDVEREPEKRVIGFLMGKGYVEVYCDRKFHRKQWVALRPERVCDT